MVFRVALIITGLRWRWRQPRNLFIELFKHDSQAGILRACCSHVLIDNRANHSSRQVASSSALLVGLPAAFALLLTRLSRLAGPLSLRLSGFSLLQSTLMRLFPHLATLFPQLLAALLPLDKCQLPAGSCCLTRRLALFLRLLLPFVPQLLLPLVRLAGFLPERFPLVPARCHFFEKVLKIGIGRVLDLLKDDQDLIFDWQRRINQGKLSHIALAKLVGTPGRLV